MSNLYIFTNYIIVSKSFFEEWILKLPTSRLLQLWWAQKMLSASNVLSTIPLWLFGQFDLGRSHNYDYRELASILVCHPSKEWPIHCQVWLKICRQSILCELDCDNRLVDRLWVFAKYFDMVPKRPKELILDK